MVHKKLLLSKTRHGITYACMLLASTLFGMELPETQEHPSVLLYKLVKANNEEATVAIEVLLRQGARPDYVDPITGDTALHKAVYFRKAETLKRLLKIVTNCNIPNSEGQTPLHSAMVTHLPTTISLSQQSINHDHENNILVQKTVDIVALLLRYGAEPLHKDLKKQNPYKYC